MPPRFRIAIESSVTPSRKETWPARVGAQALIILLTINSNSSNNTM